MEKRIRELQKSLTGKTYDGMAKIIGRSVRILIRSMILLLSVICILVHELLAGAKREIRRSPEVIAAVVGLLMLVGVFQFITRSTGTQPYEMAVYTVLPGDTIWSIAEEYAPTLSMRKDEYRDIVLNNNNIGHYIYPGDELLIPMPIKEADLNEYECQ